MEKPLIDRKIADVWEFNLPKEAAYTPLHQDIQQGEDQVTEGHSGNWFGTKKLETA